MKKFTLILIVLSFCFATNALATSTVDAGVTDTDGQTIYGDPGNISIARASKGVKFGWNSNYLGYAIVTYHNQGTKQYGTANDSTALYQEEVGTGFTLIAPAGSTVSAFDGVGDWKQL